VSLYADHHFTKRFDALAGIAYSYVGGGLAVAIPYGPGVPYNSNSNLAPTGGMPFNLLIAYAARVRNCHNFIPHSDSLARLSSGPCDQNSRVTNKVKSLSPKYRFVIALHSPGEVDETGLPQCPQEKKARKLALGI
jgi:hypothetical protein